MAFALPILLFIAALGVFEHMLRERLAEHYRTPAAFVLALTVTVVVMLAVSVAYKRSYREH